MSDNYQIRIEDAVIGACLIDSHAIDTAIGLGITIEHFSQQNAKEIYMFMTELRKDSLDVDLVTVGAKCNSQRKSELVSYMVSATQHINSSSNIESHCWFLRINLLTERRKELAKEMALAKTTEEVDEYASKLRMLEDEFEMSKGFGHAKEVSELVGESRKEWMKRAEYRSRGEMAGVTTGLAGLDKLTNGWQDSRLIILAARPGMGKTAMAIHFALSAAKAGRHVRIYSLEMTGREIVDRMICSLSDIDGYNYASGYVNELELEEFSKADEILQGLPITVNDEPIQSPEYIRADAKKARRDGQCDLVIIDYLQLIDMATGNSRNFNRENQVSSTSRKMKLMAKELDCPVILLCQLNRSVEGRSSKRPMLADLRESGSIEQDADMVLFVYRPEYYDDKQQIQFGSEDGEVIIAKQRAGALGTVMFGHNPSLTKITDAQQ